MIGKLIERGEKIKEEEWKEVRKVEREICEEILDKEEVSKKLRTPKSAYITFMNED